MGVCMWVGVDVWVGVGVWVYVYVCVCACVSVYVWVGVYPCVVGVACRNDCLIPRPSHISSHHLVLMHLHGVGCGFQLFIEWAWLLSHDSGKPINPLLSHDPSPQVLQVIGDTFIAMFKGLETQ